MTSKKASAKNRHRHVPGKLTATVVAKICELHEGGLPLMMCCEHENVSLTAFYNFLARNPEFKAEVFGPARERFIDCLEEKAFSLATSVDARYPTMLIFMLKAHRRAVYGEQVKATLTPGGEFSAAFFTAMENATRGSSTTEH